jgi:hypothetical protein
MKWALILFAGLLSVFAQCSLAQSTDEPAANPGRPTVSTPATLTPVGYMQFETGMLGAADSSEFSWQCGLVETMKLTVAPRLQFIASDQPVARSAVNDVAGNATGDVLLGAQGVLLPGEGVKPTLAASYFHRVYSGDAPDLDFGTPSNSFTLLASADVKGFHYDANFLFNEMVDGSVRRAQFGQTLSISHGLTGKLSVSGEIWHFTQPFLRGHAVGNLWAVGYTARPNLVFDAGFNRGLTSTSTQWEAFAGFTYLLPHRLWRVRDPD